MSNLTQQTDEVTSTSRTCARWALVQLGTVPALPLRRHKMKGRLIFRLAFVMTILVVASGTGAASAADTKVGGGAEVASKSSSGYRSTSVPSTGCSSLGFAPAQNYPV